MAPQRLTLLQQPLRENRAEARWTLVGQHGGAITFSRRVSFATIASKSDAAESAASEPSFRCVLSRSLNQLCPTRCRALSAGRSSRSHSRCTVASRVAPVASAISERRRCCLRDTASWTHGSNARSQLRSRRSATRKSWSASSLPSSPSRNSRDAFNSASHAFCAFASSDNATRRTPRSAGSRSRLSSSMLSGRCVEAAMA